MNVETTEKNEDRKWVTSILSQYANHILSQSEYNALPADAIHKHVSEILDGSTQVKSAVIMFTDDLDQFIFPEFEPGGFRSVEEMMQSEKWLSRKSEYLSTKALSCQMKFSQVSHDEVVGRYFSVDIQFV